HFRAGRGPRPSGDWPSSVEACCPRPREMAPDGGTATMSWRRVVGWSRLAMVVAGAGAGAYLLYDIGPRAGLECFRAMGWRLLIVLWGPYSAAVVLDTLGWAVLLRDHHVPLGVLFRARMVGEAVNLTTPTASVGGEPLKAYLLRPYVPLADGLGSV